MPIIQFSNRDLLRSTIVTPGWYRCRVHSVGESPVSTAKGPSTNYPVEMTILFDGDTGDTKFKDVPVDTNFNSKAIGFAVGFLQAFGVDVKADARFDLASAEGKELDVFVENDTYNNRLVNKINHKYRMPKPDVSAKVA